VGRSVSRQRVDDIDGSSASQSVAFALDGQWFEIDLSDAHAAALRAVFAPYVVAGRRAGSGRRAASKTSVRSQQPVRGRVGQLALADTVDSHAADQKIPRPQTPEDISEQRAHSTPQPVMGPDVPLATVVPLLRRLRAQVGELDIAGQRRRLFAGAGELIRLVAVAMLATAADRLVALIVKPAVPPGNASNAESRARTDVPNDAASTDPEAPNSSVAPTG
jgi:hypothetical protein